MSRALLKSGLIVSVMTLLSRVLGLLRDVITAHFLGAGSAADVFFFANRIPNFLRRLFAEGAFAQAFVPVLNEVKEKHGDDEVRLFVAKITGTLGLVVTCVTLFGVIFSPIIAALFGTGWFISWFNGEPDGEKFELFAVMLKFTFPYLWFISFVAISGAILNTYNRFAVAAFTPVFLNIAMISAILFCRDWFDEPAMALALGVFVGGLVQFLFQIPYLLKMNVLAKPKWAWRDKYVAKVRALMVPALFGVSVSQINLLLDTVIASFFMTGSVAWLYYSDRLIEFPLGLFGIGIATVILPRLSKLHVNESTAAFVSTMSWAIRIIIVLGTPAMLGLIVFGKPIISVLYYRGAFTADDVLMVSHSLVAYSCGLLSFMMIKVLAPGYFSRQDTKTPVKIGIIAMVANMVFNLILAPFYGYVGLALATAISATINAALLYHGLHKANVYKFDKGMVVFIIQCIAAACVMAGVVFHINDPIDIWLERSFIDKVSYLFGYLSLAVISYFAALIAFRVNLKQIFTQK